ncbi:MAG: universal stress protein [Methanoregula sp.]|nr:universal stress protein [Methanoregula sp.]
MFKKVLFPTDFSKPAKTELSCITSVPGIREIILLHVIQQYAIPMGAEMVETLEARTAETYLHEAKNYITTLNPEIRVTLKEAISNDITDAILKKAEFQKVDIIVIHGYIKSIAEGLLRGCVSAKALCRVSKTNILIMPDSLVETLTGDTFEKYCPMIFSRILCPTSLSELSEKTAALAGTMKGVGEIVLLHIVKEGEKSGDGQDEMVAAGIKINSLRERFAARGIRSRTIVVSGKPEHEIARTAQEEDVSLIWMRAAGKGCLHDFFFGSLVHDVIRRSNRPVIIIRSLPD